MKRTPIFQGLVSLSVIAIALVTIGSGSVLLGAQPGQDSPFPLAEQRRQAEEAGYTIVPAPDAPRTDEAAPNSSADAVAAGAAAFIRDYNLPIYPESRVGQHELSAPAVITAARGETEPLSIGVHALADLTDLTVEVVASDDSGPAVEVRYVEAAYIRSGGRGDKNATLTSLRLRPMEPLPLAKGMNRQFWIDAKVPLHSEGEFTYRIVIRSKGRPDLTRPLTVRVRPYALQEPDRFIGAFCSTAQIRPSVETFRQWKDHGVNGMLWFWSSLPWRAEIVDGELRFDFSDTEELIDRIAEAGLTGAVTIALGNDRNGHYELMLARLYGRPLAEKTSVGGRTANVARLDDEIVSEAYMEGVRQFNALLKKKNWPEVALLHYDEPTERLMPEATLRYQQIKTAAPTIRVYGVTMNRLEWAEMLAPISDILVCNGDYARISDLGDRTGKAVWGYSSTTASMGFGGGRFNLGFRLYRYKLGSHWFWCYDFYSGNPWNEFDSTVTGDANWVTVYPGATAGEHVPTLTWEGIREAYDDMRYAATLEKLLAEKKGPRRDKVAAEYEEFLARIPQGRDMTVFREDQDDFYSTLPSYQKLTTLRTELVGWIEQLVP